MSEDYGEVAGLEKVQDTREHFLGWQCRLRKFSVRDDEGRPTSGMRPRVSVEGEEVILGRIVVLIVKRQPEDITAQFSYIIRQTQDPVQRYEKGLKILQAEYYQRPQEFSDKLTALFGPRSGIVRRLLESERCVLDFEQHNQRYHIPCGVEALTRADSAYQATYWHNLLFNPEMPPGVQVLSFSPDWRRTTESPPRD